MDSVPNFVEPGDVLDSVQALPLFVTRQVDEASRKQRLAALAAALEQAQNIAAERPKEG